MRDAADGACLRSTLEDFGRRLLDRQCAAGGPRLVPLGRIGLRAGGGEVPLEQSLPRRPQERAPVNAVPGGRRESRREAPVAVCGGGSGEPVQGEACQGQAGDLQLERERLLE